MLQKTVFQGKGPFPAPAAKAAEKGRPAALKPGITAAVLDTGRLPLI